MNYYYKIQNPGGVVRWINLSEIVEVLDDPRIDRVCCTRSIDRDPLAFCSEDRLDFLAAWERYVTLCKVSAETAYLPPTLCPPVS